MSDVALVELDGPVAIVTMNLPRKRNAISEPLISGLLQHLDTLESDPQVRAIVLRGAGGHFCAGGDLGALGSGLLQTRKEMGLGHQLIRRLVGGRLPVVAAVEGNAFGAGFSMAMACDFVVAEPASTFCAAFGKVGLMPDYGLLWTLPARVSMGIARDIVMLCDEIPAARAHELRLVDILAEAGQVQSAAMQRAQRLAKAPPGTVAATKAALYRTPLALDAMLAWEADTQTLLIHSEDFQEGARAFREKRPAEFRGV